MTNLGSLLHSPGTQPFEKIEEKAAQVVLLRPETGAVYVQPSGWQRLRLQWIFRNFHVLSAQVLSRRDQRLIAQLARVAVVTPDLPVPGKSILGVIEKVHAPSAVVAEVADRPDGNRKPWNVSLGQLGALTVLCVIVILASAPASRTAPVRKAPARAAALKPVVPVAVLPAMAALPAATKSKRWTAPTEVADAQLEPMAGSATAERRQVTELPPGPFAHPVSSQANLDREVQLKVLIGTDGSVKAVTVVRGDPRSAEAGVRAVRHWHYRPYEELGKPVEVETLVTMKFFGADAVSIASVTTSSTSLLR